MHCAFLDASKAFDKVLHNGLFVKLLKRNVSVAFVQIIRNWYRIANLLHLFCGIIYLDRVSRYCVE